MLKNNNKFRINHLSHKNSAQISKSNPPTFANIFSKVIQAVKDKAANAYAKLENKLTDTPAVFSVGKDEREKQLSLGKLIRDRESTTSKNSDLIKDRAKSQLSREDEEKLKHLLIRKQQLMERLRKIDYELLNSPPIELGESGKSGQYQIKPVQSRIKMQQSRVYNPIQHEKTIEMLARLNTEKMRRQERIVQDMKRKQEKEIKKITEMENKSQMQISMRRNPTPLIKFNSRDTENLIHDYRTNSVAESNRKLLSDKAQNEFDELPELVTCQKAVERQQPQLDESM